MDGAPPSPPSPPDNERAGGDEGGDSMDASEEYPLGLYVAWVEDERDNAELGEVFEYNPDDPDGMASRSDASGVPAYAVVSLRACAVNTNWTWVMLCTNLIYLDLSGNRLASLCVGSWRDMHNLRVLLVHENAIDTVDELIEAAVKMPHLMITTFYGNPVASYRRRLARGVSSLQVIDDYVVADTERYDFPLTTQAHHKMSDIPARAAVYEPLNPCLRVQLPRLLPTYDAECAVIEEREGRVLAAVAAMLSHVRLVASRFNPSVQIQKVWRGRSARKDWGVYVLNARLRQKEAADGPKSPMAQVQASFKQQLEQPEDKQKLERAVIKIQCSWRRRLALYEVVKLASAQRRVGSHIYVPPNQLPLAVNILKEYSRLADSELYATQASRAVLLRPHTVSRKAAATEGRAEHRSLHTLLLDRSRAVIMRPRSVCIPDCRLKWMISRKYLRTTVSLEDALRLRHEVAARLQWVRAAPPLALVCIEVHDKDAIAWFMKKAHTYNHSQQLTPLTFYVEADIQRIVAAVDIQRVYRGYRARRPLRAAGLLGNARAIEFCATQIQALCRRMFGRRRYEFLRAMKLLIASAQKCPPPFPAHVAAAWGDQHDFPGTEVFLSFNAYRQLMFTFDHPERAQYDVSMVRPPDRNTLVPELYAIATALSVPPAGGVRKGECVVMFSRSLQQLPSWLVELGKLRSNTLPSLTPTHNYPHNVGLKEVVLQGADIPRAVIPSSKQFFKVVDAPDPRILEHFERGYLCLRYASREEAMRRRILLAALTFHSPTRSHICFEHPRRILRHDAALAIQSWYLHARLACAPPVTGSVADPNAALDAGGFPRPDATLPTPPPGATAAAIAAQRQRFVATPLSQLKDAATPRAASESPMLFDSADGDWSGVSHPASRPASSLLGNLTPRTRRLLERKHHSRGEDFGVVDDGAAAAPAGGGAYVSPAVVTDVIRERPTVRVVREVRPPSGGGRGGGAVRCGSAGSMPGSLASDGGAAYMMMPVAPGVHPPHGQRHPESPGGVSVEPLDEMYLSTSMGMTYIGPHSDDGASDSIELVGARPRQPALDMSAVAERQRMLSQQERREMQAHVRHIRDNELQDRRARVAAARHARQRQQSVAVSDAWDDGLDAPVDDSELETALKIDIGRGVPKRVKFNLAQLKLSATLQQFAGQAGAIEREGWTGSDTADLHVTAADLKWMTSRELSTLAAAKTAREAVQAKADVALKRYSNLQSRIVLQEKRHTAQRARATQAEAYRVKYNSELYRQWRDEKDAVADVRQRRENDAQKARQVHSQRGAVGAFMRQQNILDKEAFGRALQAKRSHEQAESARVIYQARVDTWEARHRMANWTEAELKLRRAVYAYGVRQQRRALDEREEEDRAHVHKMREEHRAKGDSKRQELLEKFEAVPTATGEFTRVRTLAPADLPPRPVKVQTVTLPPGAGVGGGGASSAHDSQATPVYDSSSTTTVFGGRGADRPPLPQDTLAIHVYPRECDLPRHPASRVRPGTAVPRPTREHNAFSGSVPRTRRGQGKANANANAPRRPAGRRPQTARPAAAAAAAAATGEHPTIAIPQAVILTPPTQPNSHTASPRRPSPRKLEAHRGSFAAAGDPRAPLPPHAGGLEVRAGAPAAFEMPPLPT